MADKITTLQNVLYAKAEQDFEGDELAMVKLAIDVAAGVARDLSSISDSLKRLAESSERLENKP